MIKQLEKVGPRWVNFPRGNEELVEFFDKVLKNHHEKINDIVAELNKGEMPEPEKSTDGIKLSLIPDRELSRGQGFLHLHPDDYETHKAASLVRCEPILQELKESIEGGLEVVKKNLKTCKGEGDDESLHLGYIGAYREVLGLIEEKL